MSRVDKWNKEPRNIRLQDIAETVYSTTYIENEKIFQITTFGSESRKFKGDASQMIQFNKARANELIDILKLEFNID